MRTLSADWMANTIKPEAELQSAQHSGEESKGNFFYPRPVAPTAAQVSLNLITPHFACWFIYLIFSFPCDGIFFGP